MTRQRFKQLKAEGRINFYKELTPPSYYIPDTAKQVKSLTRLTTWVVQKVLEELDYEFKMIVVNNEECYTHSFKRNKYQVFLPKNCVIRTETCKQPDVPFGYRYVGYKYQPLYFRTWTKKA